MNGRERGCRGILVQDKRVHGVHGGEDSFKECRVLQRVFQAILMPRKCCLVLPSFKERGVMGQGDLV